VHARTIYGCLERARNAYLVILYRCYSNPYQRGWIDASGHPPRPPMGIQQARL
jgi:hypothetical protein